MGSTVNDSPEEKKEDRFYLLLVRHAIAESREEFAKTRQIDELRPLTEEGIQEMRKNSVGLSRIYPDLSFIGSSPLTRAWQTAEILHESYERLKPEHVTELRPDMGYDSLIAWLRKHRRNGFVGLVGHEPYLSSFAHYATQGRASSLFKFKKGGAALLRFKKGIRPAGAELLALLEPKHLQAFGSD
jgi:phosphohistidine phosphatase